MYCSKCGTQIDGQAAFCPRCGAPAAAVGPAGEVYKSKIAAGLLGIFLGELGIHRFYLGFVGIGIIQIVVTIVTLGIGGLWGFIEGILILTGSMNKDAKGQPLRD
jgi:TM2 domain-containing membrane protein YozV